MTTTVDDPSMEVFDGSDWRSYTDARGGWFGGTYRETCDDRDDLYISFKGTGIRVYGAKRPTYGYFYGEVDGKNRRYFNAHSTRDEIPALLFEATGLGDHDHTLWMMNQQNYGGSRSRSCLGIDYMEILDGRVGSSPATTQQPVAQPSPSPEQSNEPSLLTASPEASADPAPSAEADLSSSINTEVGNAISSSSSAVSSVPGLANYTRAPSANEVPAPNSTWATGSLTAVAGQGGVFTGQPLPVFTGPAINTIGAGPPNLKQDAFVTGVMAGSSSSAWTLSPSTPLSVMLVGCWMARWLR